MTETPTEILDKIIQNIQNLQGLIVRHILQQNVNLIAALKNSVQQTLQLQQPQQQSVDDAQRRKAEAIAKEVKTIVDPKGDIMRLVDQYYSPILIAMQLELPHDEGLYWYQTKYTGTTEQGNKALQALKDDLSSLITALKQLVTFSMEPNDVVDLDTIQLAIQTVRTLVSIVPNEKTSMLTKVKAFIRQFQNTMG